MAQLHVKVISQMIQNDCDMFTDPFFAPWVAEELVAHGTDGQADKKGLVIHFINIEWVWLIKNIWKMTLDAIENDVENMLNPVYKTSIEFTSIT